MRTRADLEKIFKRGRSALFTVVMFNTIDIILSLTRSGFTFIVAAIVPSLIIGLWHYSIVAIAVALVIVALYYMCYLLSKKHKVFVLVALIFYSIDTFLILLLAIISLFTKFEFLMIVYIAFHAMIIYPLAKGVKAWADLENKRYGEEPEPKKIDEPEKKEIDAKECPFCGGKISVAAVFCQYCGGNVKKKEEFDKKRKQQEFKEKGLNILFDDEKIMEEANMYKRMYGKSACVSYLKDKAKAFGLGDIEITAEDVGS